ncbi:L-histidine N(alpha)-methyltransferase [Teichococcus oryzae]|uniref:L-histidine N(Alpha)-methyltransferase n=1 Tax=Teichococcus oryzae TaxID=1608942 RepID=A0A5B2TE36_9PROT|nr:L-histidine N(alpha)-methyltransferase [Pseudoroseomonas oryzae]KAA2212383.1 L-histidine N(alpha)-methyltransferase [Pseudoroseomonas oryzae]
MLDAPETAWQHDAFRDDVIAGLSRPRKTLPSRWLYDDRGCRLFEEITRLDEYYPTRTETTILRDQAAAMAGFAGPAPVLVEYGAGAAVKTAILLEALRPSLYIPVDIAGDFLAQSAARITRRFPELKVRPVIADFTADFDLPAGLPAGVPRCGFFPGSTIGNLDAEETSAFLCRMRAHVGTGGTALVGVDLRKDLDTLLAAYDDRAGVTAAFNLNLLTRINRELGADFPPGGFSHEARWNARESAIEMHLVCRRDCLVALEGRRFAFRAGESIHTESSRKYDLDSLAALAAPCGWAVEHGWTDRDRLFAVAGLRAC